jgi:hypothetical protein
MPAAAVKDKEVPKAKQPSLDAVAESVRQLAMAVKLMANWMRRVEPRPETNETVARIGHRLQSIENLIGRME